MQENSITIGLGLPTVRVLGREELPRLLMVTVVYRQGERICSLSAPSIPPETHSNSPHPMIRPSLTSSLRRFLQCRMSIRPG